MLQKSDFQENFVEVVHISDEEMYYSGSIFVPSVPNKFVKTGTNNSVADEVHFNGFRIQSYGKSHEIFGYNWNN